MVDIFVVILILLTGVVGFKRGFFKEIVMTVGWLIIFLLAWVIKDPIASFLSLNLPFIDFFGIFKGITIINILLYQIIAFIFVYSILMIIYRIVLKITGIFEKFLNATIILGIPSKILGFVVGLIKGYIIAFVLLFIFSLPVFNLKEVNNSSIKNTITQKTPVLSNVVGNVNDTVEEIFALEKKYHDSTSKEDFNKECIKVMLKNKIISKEYIKKLSNSGKIKVDNIEELLNSIEN